MWRKSSYSGTDQGGACVEVAFAKQVGIRDSKNPDPSLTFPVESFRALVGLARLSPPLDRGNV